MLVVQILLPRFLVLETVLFVHFFHPARGLVKKSTEKLVKSCAVPFGNDSAVRWDPLYTDTATGSFIMPTENGQIVISEGQTVTLTCPHATLHKIGDGSADSVEVECSGGAKLEAAVPASGEGGDRSESQEVQGIEPESVSCSQSIRETVRDTDSKCGPKGSKARLAHVGWMVAQEFRPQFTVCHDKGLEHTYYANHSIDGPHITSRSHNEQRPHFKEGGHAFYKHSSARQAYKKSHQKTGGSVSSAHLGSSFFAKGHLAPKADFVYGEAQDATHYYFNAAPQWHPYNNGEWKAVEESVRRLAARRARALSVQTGTHGNLDGLSLGHRGRIPVPRYFWKLVYDPVARDAIVFVLTNDPGSPSRRRLCRKETTCRDAGWSDGAEDNNLLQCCTYQSFKDAVPWIAELPAGTKLLANSTTDSP